MFAQQPISNERIYTYQRKYGNPEPGIFHVKNKTRKKQNPTNNKLYLYVIIKVPGQIGMVLNKTKCSTRIKLFKTWTSRNLSEDV